MASMTIEESDMEPANHRSFRISSRLFLVIFGLTALFAVVYWHLLCVRCEAETDRDEALPPRFAKLLPLYSKLSPPQPGDWLDKHFELGQTYQQYLRGRPTRVEGQRRTIYVQPLGEMNPTQRKIIDLAAEYLGVYYQLPAKVCEPLPLDSVPDDAKRQRGDPEEEQLLTTYLLEDVLKPRFPDDAVAFIAFTTKDLWPGEGWNRVYGQALSQGRVGVWSIYCFGDPDAGRDAFHRCLLRTLKTASHETGHIFSIAHCTLYECDMCGSNHLEEADRRPAEMCPQCLAKLCHATGAKPAQRFQQLVDFYKAHDLKAEQAFAEQSLKIWNASGKLRD
jgi:archaemetzincin